MKAMLNGQTQLDRAATLLRKHPLTVAQLSNRMGIAPRNVRTILAVLRKRYVLMDSGNERDRAYRIEAAS